ncbi:MAG: AsmA family protein, partial [Deltaproteobacteria bacterium]|nr:AsmA family protein [Deltaproteobacteria bacterium]
MAKLLKIIGVLAALVVVVIVGMNIFIKSYLTNTRIKALVIPPLERALDRKVTIGSIGVSLFSGVVIKDFAIKERDGKTDFIHSRAFKISYDLMPLLHKKLTVSEILLDSPTIMLVRDRAGKFNFASLAAGAAAKDEADTGKSAAITLPIALSVKQIRIKNAKITFRDFQKELPDADITADLRLKVRIGRDLDLTKLNFQGHLQAQVDAVYGKIKPHAKIQADFDARQITFTVDKVIGGERIAVKGKVKNYMGKPDIQLDVSSRELNLDYLAAMGAALPHKGKPAGQQRPVSARAKTAIAASLPPGLYLPGVIRINKALY